ncbi:MAG: SDR family oxidoreductase [Gammaproteobacteria bacterium]
MQLDFRKRVALLPAASAGLGRAVALELAASGARITISGRDPNRLETTARDLLAAGASDVLALAGDCTVAADAEALVRGTEARFGRVDVLVANSPGAPVKPFERLTDDDWRAALDTKLVTQARQARLVWPGMVERGYGRIVFIAGTHGRQPHAHVLTAGVVNAGLLSLAKGLAEAGAPHGILVNTVNPGPTDTDRMRYLVARKAIEESISEEQARASFSSDIILGRFGRPAEIAAAIAFLASDRASFITGVSLNVDGGQTRTI